MDDIAEIHRHVNRDCRANRKPPTAPGGATPSDRREHEQPRKEAHASAYDEFEGVD